MIQKILIFSKWALLISILVVLAGCSSSTTLDHSRTNHPAMDFENPLTMGASSVMTNLDSFERSSGGASCSTCAN